VEVKPAFILSGDGLGLDVFRAVLDGFPGEANVDF
jgi:hypothetical protein